MIISAARRLSDGLLADIQISTNAPKDAAPRLGNAVAQFGGAVTDYELITLSSEQYAATQTAMPAVPYLNNGTITTRSVPIVRSPEQRAQEQRAALINDLPADWQDWTTDQKDRFLQYIAGVPSKSIPLLNRKVRRLWQ